VKSAKLFRTLTFLASKDDIAAPVSIRAGRVIAHGTSMTSSTSPIMTFWWESPTAALGKTTINRRSKKDPNLTILFIAERISIP
jgi:hypothetical protein